MKKLMILATLALVSCTDKVKSIPLYPGHQARYEECHVRWDLGYDVDVQKCEKEIANTKFKIGQTVHHVDYDATCKARIITNRQWSMTNEILYTIKVYCDGKPMHDEYCEKGHWLNCPKAAERDLY